MHDDAVVDPFADEPLACVTEADDLPEQGMADIAAGFYLSGTTFVSRPIIDGDDADTEHEHKGRNDLREHPTSSEVRCSRRTTRMELGRDLENRPRP